MGGYRLWFCLQILNPLLWSVRDQSTPCSVLFVFLRWWWYNWVHLQDVNYMRYSIMGQYMITIARHIGHTQIQSLLSATLLLLYSDVSAFNIAILFTIFLTLRSLTWIPVLIKSSIIGSWNCPKWNTDGSSGESVLKWLFLILQQSHYDIQPALTTTTPEPSPFIIFSS